MKQSKFANRTSELHTLEKRYHKQGLHSGSNLYSPIGDGLNVNNLIMC